MVTPGVKLLGTYHAMENPSDSLFIKISSISGVTVLGVYGSRASYSVFNSKVSLSERWRSVSRSG